MPNNNDARLRELSRWLEAQAGLSVTRIEPASEDASFRRYFRVFSSNGRFIAMDAPPEREDCEPFMRIAGYLRATGLHSPRIVNASRRSGFLLLSDLGDRPYLEALRADPSSADPLYADAIKALLQLQQKGNKYQSRLPSYDDALLTRELALFRDWLCGQHLGLDFSARDERHWQTLCHWLIEHALQQPRVFVHRDYHSRNLMVVDDNNPGILDFQDAVEGPLTYDLVSLLKDCYIRWPADWVRDLALDFFRCSLPFLPYSLSEAEFLRFFEIMGVQRHLKAAGIFARLKHRDGKSAYMADVPRTLGYIMELAPRYPELDFITGLIDARCLPALDGTAAS